MVQTSIGKARTPINVPISLVLNHLFVKRHELSLYFTVLLKFAVHKNFSINKLVKSKLLWLGMVFLRVSKML